jgi:tRNA/rRNA methyltransferase
MTSAFSRVRFVLTEPSHPGNVGSAARAVKNMGFEDLWLAAPQSPHMTSAPEAIALASGATDILGSTQTAAQLDQALRPVTLAFALTARARELGPPACDIREAALMAKAHLEHPENRVAMVFGCERAGLSNEQVSLCQRVCHIPANPLYSSLNVSQALQLVAWELRYALIQAHERLPQTPDLAPDPGKTPAKSEAVQALLAHWEQALVAVKFLDPAHPKKLIPRMQHLLQRSGLSREEVDMWRGLCTAMIKTAQQSQQPDQGQNSR